MDGFFFFFFISFICLCFYIGLTGSALSAASECQVVKPRGSRSALSTAKLNFFCPIFRGYALAVGAHPWLAHRQTVARRWRKLAGGAGTAARANNPSTDILVRQRDPDICRDATVKIQFLCFSYPANAGRGSTESPTYRLFSHSHSATCGLPATSQAEVCRSNIEKDVTNKFINLYE
ncbi:MAG: hypothetical protein J5942_09325 [Prevotella sp.]|nr:hypothetical protein [Prevotella sp.]